MRDCQVTTGGRGAQWAAVGKVVQLNHPPTLRAPQSYAAVKRTAAMEIQLIHVQRAHMAHIQYPYGQPRYTHTSHKSPLCLLSPLPIPHFVLYTVCAQSIHVYPPSRPHSFLRPLPAPAAGLGSSQPVPSIITRQECIKDSSLQLNLKGKTMTPGIAAELWRPPIKLFAFDLILSFLPPM